MRNRFRRCRLSWARGCGAAVLLSMLFATACTATSADVQTDDATPDDVALVVVGDSLTAGTRAMEDGEVRGEGSWVPAALGAPLVLEGGWAVPGATTADMRTGVSQTDGDVLVIMAGTNDIARGLDWEASRDNLLTITRTLRIETVVVSAVPPFAPRPEAATGYNDRLQQVAIEQGWTFVDPWSVAAEDGQWAEDASLDGVHPTQEVADDVGRNLRTAVLAQVTGD